MDHYELLGITRSFRAENIPALRRELAKRFHPNNGLEPDERRMAKINAACDVLGHVEKRKKYDDELTRIEAEKAQAEAARKRAERARAAREQRERSDGDAKAFGDQVREQTSGGGSQVPPPAPPRAFRPPPQPPQPTPVPPRSPSTPRPKAPNPSRRAVAPTRASGKLAESFGMLVLALVFLGAPFGVMYFVAPALNAHPNIILDLVSIGCFFWFLAGVVAVFTTLGDLFTALKDFFRAPKRVV